MTRDLLCGWVPPAALFVLALAWLGTALAEGDRLAVAGGRLTEIVFALGAGGQVVGVDSTSVWPPEAQALPRFGYVRSLPVEGILALAPDRLLVVPEAGPARAVQRLRAAMNVHVLPPVHGPRDVPDAVRHVAGILQREAEGEAVAAALQSHLQRIDARRPDGPAPRVLILLATGGDTLLAGGGDSAAQAFLDALGLANAVQDLRGFRPLGREALLGMETELIIVAETEPGAFRPGAWPVLDHTPAGRRGRVLVRDSMYLLGFGLRVADAMEEVLAAATDPDFVAWKR